MIYRLILVVCLATLGLADHSWGQVGDKIAFISDREGYDDVWIMNADGSDPVNLTNGQHCTSPAWSPDGARLAYIGSGEIWFMDADGSHPQQLTDDSGDKVRLWWSEDGRNLYYITAPTVPLPDDWDGPDAFVAALNGSSSSPVDWREVLRRFHPGRSPDGTQLATVTLWNGGDHIHTDLHIRTSDSDHLHPGILLPESHQNMPMVSLGSWRTYPAWSPDGTRIAFARFRQLNGPFEIWAVDIDEKNWIELTNGLGGREPAWRPAIPTATSAEAQTWGQVKSLLSNGGSP